MSHLTLDPETFRALAPALEKARTSAERFVLENEGQPVGALVSVEELDYIEQLETRLDVLEAEKVLAEMALSGEKPVPYEEFRKELGLK